MKTTDLPTLPFSTKNRWAEWLSRQHDKSVGVWLKLAKKDSGIASVTYDEALEAALCYGWIDGQKKGFDDKYWLQKFTPRGPKSIWSKINTVKSEKLIASGEMKPAGLKAIELAKQDGLWEAAYESQKNISIPDDFQAALDKNKKAKAFFATLNSVNRYAILFRIQTAKKARRARSEYNSLWKCWKRTRKYIKGFAEGIFIRMREIIKSLVLFVEEDQTGPLLENAEKQFGHQNLRLFSDEILNWLRSDLFVPRNKAIRYDNRPGWFSDFSLFVKNLGELNELFRCGKYSVDFREEISFAERVEIHQYVAENYKPHLFIAYR